MTVNKERVLLSTQRALVGAITKNMKAITIGFTKTSYTLRVYFEVQYSEEELELLKDITGEVSADIPEFVKFTEEAIIDDSNKHDNQLEMLDFWVYMEHCSYE